MISRSLGYTINKLLNFDVHARMQMNFAVTPISDPRNGLEWKKRRKNRSFGARNIFIWIETNGCFVEKEVSEEMYAWCLFILKKCFISE